MTNLNGRIGRLEDIRSNTNRHGADRLARQSADAEPFTAKIMQLVLGFSDTDHDVALIKRQTWSAAQHVAWSIRFDPDAPLEPILKLHGIDPASLVRGEAH